MKKNGAVLILSLLVIFFLTGCGGSSSSSPVDQYEKLVDEMVMLMQKGLAGDISAMQDIAKLQPDIKKLQETLRVSDLSKEDVARLEKAMEKLASVF
jgi:hypothetical protein